MSSAGGFFVEVIHSVFPFGGLLMVSRYLRMSPTRQAVIPGETFILLGKLPLRHFRQMVVEEYGKTR